MFKFIVIAFVLFVTGSNAAWSSCNLPGVLSPDQIVSTHCPGDRCVATIGAHFYANFLLLLTHSSCHPPSIIVELFNPFSCVPSSPSFPLSLARCQVMKQSIKELCYELFFEFLHHGSSKKGFTS